VFYYDYRNKQVRGKFDDPLFGALDELVNLPKSRILVRKPISPSVRLPD
jgi:hypothetical protein